MIGLTPRQLEVAQVLAELGPGATLAAIGAELEMGRSQVQETLRILHERGWLADDLRTLVVSVPMPDDVEIEVTAGGRAYLARPAMTAERLPSMASRIVVGVLATLVLPVLAVLMVPVIGAAWLIGTVARLWRGRRA